MCDLRAKLPAWERRYQQRSVPNDGYNTIGLIVPLAEFEQIAYLVI